MFDGLYLLYDEEKDRWQLRLEDSYYCVSVVQGQEDIEKCIKDLVKKYKTEVRLRRALEETDSRGRLGKIEFARQEDLFKKQGHLYRDIVRGVVREAMTDIKKDSPVLKNRKRFNKVDILKEEESPSARPLDKEDTIIKIKVPKNRPSLKGVALGVRLLKI